MPNAMRPSASVDWLVWMRPSRSAGLDAPAVVHVDDVRLHAVAGPSGGEGHTLSGEEAHRAAAAAVAAVDGAAPVIAGIIANSTREVVQRGTALAELGVAALQITPVHYLFRPGDAVDAGILSRRGADRPAGDHLQRGAVELSGAGAVVPHPGRRPRGDRGQAERRRPEAAGRPAARGARRQPDPQRRGRPALPFVRPRRAWRGGGDPERGAGRLRFAVGCGRRRRPALRPRPARQAAGAVERHRRRQPAGLREARPEPAAVPGRPAARPHAARHPDPPSSRRSPLSALEALGVAS